MVLILLFSFVNRIIDIFINPLGLILSRSSREMAESEREKGYVKEDEGLGG